MRDFSNYQNLPEILRVRVTPKAKSERIRKEVSPDGSVLYKISVTAVPEKGKANEVAIKLLAKALGVAKSSLVIARGSTVRDKIIKINTREEHTV